MFKKINVTHEDFIWDSRRNSTLNKEIIIQLDGKLFIFLSMIFTNIHTIHHKYKVLKRSRCCSRLDFVLNCG